MKPIRWTGAFALSWSVWLGGMAIGLAVVEWIGRQPWDAVAVPAATGGAGDGMGQSAPPRGPAASPSTADLFLFILGRNVTVYVWLLAGLLSAGAITFLVLLANGVLLGQAIGFAAWSGLPPAAIADLVLPHGILEVGAFCIAGAVGFQGFRLAFGPSAQSREAIKALRLGLVLAFGVGVLAIAAGVEAIVTAEMAASLTRRYPGVGA